MSRYTGPLLTRPLGDALCAARDAGHATWQGSLDLDRSRGEALLSSAHWTWRGADYPYPGTLKDRTLYWWDGDGFAPVSRYAGKLIKLVPTTWSVPTFEIDGIKMLPTSKESPLDDARRKVALVQPQGKTLLDTCGGLGYFAACCLDAGVARIRSFEKNEDVLWLRTLNPWSPDPAESGGRLDLAHADVSQAIAALPDAAFDAVLHDPPRFGIAPLLRAAMATDRIAGFRHTGVWEDVGTPERLAALDARLRAQPHA